MNNVNQTETYLSESFEGNNWHSFEKKPKSEATLEVVEPSAEAKLLAEQEKERKEIQKADSERHLFEMLEREIESAQTNTLPFSFRVSKEIEQVDRDCVSFQCQVNHLTETGLVTLAQIAEFRTNNTPQQDILKVLELDYIKKNGLNKGLEHIKDDFICDMIQLGEKQQAIEGTAKTISFFLTRVYQFPQFLDWNNAQFWQVENEQIQFKGLEAIEPLFASYIETEEQRTIYIALLEMQRALYAIWKARFSPYSAKLLRGQDFNLFQKMYESVAAESINPLTWTPKNVFKP